LVKIGFLDDWLFHVSILYVFPVSAFLYA